MKTTQPFYSHHFSTISSLSIVVVGLVTVLSLAGLLFPMATYSNEEVRQSFVANDLLNLLIGVPALLGTLWLIRRAKLFGLLGMPGAMFYVTYNSIAYATAVPFTWSFYLHLVLIILSVATIFLIFSSVDGTAVQERLQGRVAERFGAGALMGLGALFFLRTIAEFFDGTTGIAEFGVLVADGLTTPFWILGGLFLWRKQPLGYISGAGLLFQASMLFVGLLAFFILQPFITNVPTPLMDFVVILVMGLVVFIPFGLFLRGLVSSTDYKD
jgi:hypothetical protein